MKNKRTIDTGARVYKRKSTNQPIGNTSIYNEKTILDFWRPQQAKKASKKTKSKSRSVSQERENSVGAGTGSKPMPLVKNPSKHLLTANNITLFPKEQLNDYKKKILFNEEFVGNLKTILEPLIKLSRTSLFSQNFTHSFLNDNIFEIFIQENIESLIIKFLMQISDDFVYVPLGYTSKNGESAEKTKLKLIEGFNDVKKLSLQYHASNSTEILNDDLSSALKRYLKYFNKKKKKKNFSSSTINSNSILNHPNRRSFVILNKDYIEIVKTIETICNDMDYKMIKLDELENGKINKLNKISEATQSQRLSCLPEIISDKLKVLERIINNDNQKFNNLVNKPKDKDNEVEIVSCTFPPQISTNPNNPNESITNYFSHDTKVRNVYNIIQDNIYQICAKKKTMILIVDSFTQTEDDKIYLNGIINKISNTKCPIVILTNNLNFAKNDNLFNNSSKTINNHFTFYQTENSNKNFQQKAIHLTQIVILLHTLLKEQFDMLMEQNEKLCNEKGNNYEITQYFITELVQIFNKNYLNSLHDEINLISDISIRLSMIFNYDLDKIFHFIHESLRKNKNYNSKEKLNCLHKDLISNYLFNYEHLFNENGASDGMELKNLLKSTEKNSFDDYMHGKIQKIAGKNYNKFYYDIYLCNEKIAKNSTIIKKEKDFMKNNEQLINLENLIPEKYINENLLIREDLQIGIQNMFSNKFNNFYEISSKIIKQLNKEDKIFLGGSHFNRSGSITLQVVCEINDLLQYLNNLNYEYFLTLFGIRKPRSTRKLCKEKDSQAMMDDTKVTAFSKILYKNLNIKQLDRYFEAHDMENNLYKLNDKLIFNQQIVHYHTEYRICEEIKNNETQVNNNSIEEQSDEWSSFSECELNE